MSYMIGLAGWQGAAISYYLTFCTKTQPNVIQESANTVSRALSRNKSTTIKVERWIRPATSESMCVYKSIVK